MSSANGSKVLLPLVLALAFCFVAWHGTAGAEEIQLGQQVAAPWGGGLYLGTVQALKGETADVLYADDKQVRPVNVAELRVITPQTWSNGDRVLAVWSSGKFYEGTITGDKGGGVYTVKWADGSAPSDVTSDKILAAGKPEQSPLTSLKSWLIRPGAAVAAPWGGGMYLGTVQALKGDMADVLYADDKQVRPVKVTDLRALAPKAWKVGDKVLAVWTTGKFYSGTITADKGQGLYTVKWADGSAPSDVKADRIMAP